MIQIQSIIPRNTIRLAQSPLWSACPASELIVELASIFFLSPLLLFRKYQAYCISFL
jgi:hypothetical protein